MSKGSVIIAGTQSGVGKTTISIGIMAALAERGMSVAPFKVGPDFIDPAYHAHVTGRPSRNLDGWMMGKRAVVESHARGSAGADITVIEGVMGLYDGVGRGLVEGSTAEVARLTGSPVVLVVDARSMAGSAAAVVKGFETLDPDVDIAGVILNRVGSARHEALLRSAIKRHCRARVIGAVPRDETLDMPSRHLGLTTDVPGILTRKFLRRLTGSIEKNLDLDKLIRVSRSASAAKSSEARTPPGSNRTARLAVAMDEAFCFYYRENLELLESLGLEIVPFSPLKDDGLPRGTSGIYVGGGYPEMYARGLGFNDFVKHDLAAAIAAGIPVYAECGGLMYLTRGITDLEGVFHPMVGVLPTRARMLGRRKALGYREVTVTLSGSYFPRGKKARGHEFHYSEIEPMKAGVKHVYDVLAPGSREHYREGYAKGNVLASYVHLHFASNRGFAGAFAEKVKSVRVPYKRT